MSRLLRRNKTK